MRTYSQKPAEVARNWYVVDASGVALGRLATMVAEKLAGKHKPTYTPHTDAGDHVIVINASQLKLTGNKATSKRYYRHSGYPGGLSSKTFEQEFNSHPERVVEYAVTGMLPDNKLRTERLKRLRVYPDDQHPHSPQQPTTLEVE